MRKRNRVKRLPVKPIFGLFILILLLFFGAGYLANRLKKSDFFKIKDVIIRESDASGFTADLSYLKGRNMLTLDLEKEERLISQMYPGYRKIKLIRILPDRLFADFIKRKPVAYVKLYRYFCVDEGGVLLDAQSAGEPDLPVISGLNKKILTPKPGKRYDARGLRLAINIINTVKGNKTLKNLQIKKIDVADPENTSFLISNPDSSRNLEIKIGQENINDKINIFGSLFIQVKNDWDNIKYIDLRFKEPVIKFRGNVNK